MVIATPKCEVLSHDEESRLIKMVQTTEGSRRKYAMDRLVRHNSGLIHRLVQKFPLKNAVVTYDDLYQVGACGFIHAVEMFELNRGLKVSCSTELKCTL